MSLMWRNDEQNLPTSLQQIMRDRDEATRYESWWDQTSELGMKPPGLLAQPAHDLGIVPLIEESHQTTLRNAIQKYLKEGVAQDESFLKTVNVQDPTWEDVLEEASRARSAYENKGSRNPVRRALRRSDGLQRNVKPLIEGIPADNGMGLIKGGLQIVLHAVQRRTETCQLIFDTFESLPIKIKHAQVMHKTHSSNREFCRAVESLYYELVKCLPKLISILLREDQSRWKKYSKSVYGDSTAEVNDVLKPMLVAHDRLQQCQFELMSQGIVDTVKLSELLIHEQHATREQIWQQHEELKLESMKQAQRQQEQDNKHKDKLAAEMQQIRILVHEIMLSNAQEKKNGFFIFAQEGRRGKMLMQANAFEGTWENPPVVDMRWELTETLCNQAEKDAPFQDRLSLLRKYHDFNAKSLARAGQLFRHPRFRKWVADFGSDVLLINGQCGGDTIGSTSPVSVFCASLTETFSNSSGNEIGDAARLPQSPRIILEYFCDQHNIESSGLSGPQGMMRSLLSQLLHHWPAEASLDLQEVVSLGVFPLKDLSIRDMGALFLRALRQLPQTFPVWAIIDNISYFETTMNGWSGELAEVINCFSQCVQEDQLRSTGAASIKFLLATPHRSIYIWQMLDDSHQVTLEDGYSQALMTSNNIYSALTGA